MGILWWLLPVIVMGLCLGVIGFVFIRKIPRLRVVDVSSSPKERNKRTKDQILMQRLERVHKTRLTNMSRAAMKVVGGVSRMGRRAVQRVHAWEQYYEKLKKSSTNMQDEPDLSMIDALIEEAEGYAKNEEYVLAEKKYIEVISHHPRNTKAYQGLADVYAAGKQYDEAKETLLFVLRLTPENAQVHAQMAELETLLHRPKQALEQASRAIELAPKHPKILDTFIETAFLAGEKKEAERGIKLMEKVNPENTKLSGWKERLNAS